MERIHLIGMSIIAERQKIKYVKDVMDTIEHMATAYFPEKQKEKAIKETCEAWTTMIECPLRIPYKFERHYN